MNFVPLILRISIPKIKLSLTIIWVPSNYVITSTWISNYFLSPVNTKRKTNL